MDRNAAGTGVTLKQLQTRLSDLQRTKVNLQIGSSDFRTVSREIDQLERRINNLNSGGVKKGSGGLMGIGSAIMGNPYVATAMAIGASVGKVGELSAKKESAITGLSTFIGKDKANEAYANIQKDADVTPYGVDSLLSVNRALISAGLSAKDARQDAMNLANAISAVGGGNDELTRMAANMQQIKTVGVATATDIKQFGIAGINIYQMLADATGKPIDKVKEMSVSYDLLAYAMDKAGKKGGIYYDALNAQSQTLGGKWSTLMDTLKGVATDLGDWLGPYLKKLVQWVTEMVDFYRNLFKNWDLIMKNAKQWMSEWWQNLGDDILYWLTIKGYKILAWADDLGKSIGNSISSGLKDISGGLIDMGQDDAPSVYTGVATKLEEEKKAKDKEYRRVSNARVDIFRNLTGLNKYDGSQKQTNTATENKERKYNFSGAKSDEDGKKDSKKNLEKVSKDVNGITGGGTRNVYITVGKFFDNIIIKPVNGLQQGLDDFEERVMDVMLRVTNSAGQ
jgi:tape measure domain-containing protein